MAERSPGRITQSAAGAGLRDASPGRAQEPGRQLRCGREVKDAPAVWKRMAERSPGRITQGAAGAGLRDASPGRAARAWPAATLRPQNQKQPGLMEGVMWNQRELEILKYIQEHKTLNIEQIGRRFWLNNGSRLAKLKMKEMATKGLVIQICKEFLRIPTHYYLTPKGLSVLQTNGLTFEDLKTKLPKPTNRISGEFQHDTKLTDLRITLELKYAKDDFKWIPESGIWADKERFGLTHPDLKGEKLRNRIPDGIIIFKGKIYIVEYEHASYDKAKFENHMRAWEESWGQYFKLIITRTESRAMDLYQKGIGQLEGLRQSKNIKVLLRFYKFISYDLIISKGLSVVD
jgi:hypothetical protein